MVGITGRRVNWVLDADIRDFFGQLDHGWLRKFLRHRIADERVLRLLDKWLTAGVVEDGQWAECDEGSPQGASVSPLRANVYLHYVLGPPREFRTVAMGSNYAATWGFRYSSWASLGVR